MSMFEKMVVVDPDKMAQQIIHSVDRGDGRVRMAQGSDAYEHIRAALLERLAALEVQKDLAYSTDAYGVLEQV